MSENKTPDSTSVGTEERHSRASPHAPIMTACQVLTWIAFCEAKTREQLTKESLAHRRRCAEHAYFRGHKIDARDWWSTDPLLQNAWNQLRDALLNERITAYGKPHDRKGKPNEGAEHKEIPTSTFMDEWIAVTVRDRVEPDDDTPMEQWALRRPRKRYSDVTFKTLDVLRLWAALEGQGVAAVAALDQSIVNSWMLKEAQEASRANKPLKRAAALKACREANECTVAKAIAAWRELPTTLRRGRGKPRKGT